ncbi:hypothetical protein E3N88_33146 [Mikania micrantha]|uniref:CCHC-type domain-containing protein n=1 Tax=Mikania micrantha TaxID=192012 RepID=A0A5N6MB35_9ASTR|nr:hypothetical protein E3N88_33146 [Mikania micrantha]
MIFERHRPRSSRKCDNEVPTAVGQNLSTAGTSGIRGLSGIVTKFKSLGSNLEDEVVVRKLLNSALKKFLQIVASIEQYSDLETMSFEEVVGRLKAYEERITDLDEKEIDQEKLLMAKGEEQERSKQKEPSFERYDQSRGYNNGDRGRGYRRGNGRGENGRGRGMGHGSFRDKSELKCYECGKYGHFAYECPNWNGKEEETNLTRFHLDSRRPNERWAETLTWADLSTLGPLGLSWA